MATNQLLGLFQTPEEVRAAQQKKLQEQGLTASAMLTRGSQGSSTALPGLLQGFAGNIAANIPANAQNLVQGVLGASGTIAGAMGNQQAAQTLQQAAKSPEELQAIKLNSIIAQNKGDVSGLRKAAQQLMQQGDMKNAYALLQLAKDMADETGVDINDTNDNKNILFIAKNQLQCDIRDPKCLEAARKIYIDTKRADSAKNQMEVAGYKGLSEKYQQAETSRSNIMVANDSLRLLDSGKVNVGAFAKTRQGAQKMYTEILQGLGFAVESEADAVARTSQLMAQTKRLAGQLLQSGMFGAGTGISERDLQTAMEMSGSAENLTPQAMKQILEYNAKFEQVKLKQYNKGLERYSDAFWMRTPEGSADAFYVNIPEVYQSTPPPVKTKQVIIDEMMHEIPEGAQGGSIKGTPVYKLNGKYYNINGEEYVYGQ